jgi:transcriptional regulator with XRE-family HTH domain
LRIAERLEHLFAETAGVSGRAVTLQEIINRITESGIATMSLSYLQQLRTGQAENPRLKHIEALADAFRVPVSYFLDEEPASADTLTPMERSVALRVHGLSPDALRSINSVIDLARKGEGLARP